MSSNPFESLRSTMSCDPRDWARDARDAWTYGIVVGWGDVLDDVASAHGWSRKDVVRLLTLREVFVRAENDRVIAEAARQLIAACDHTLGASWRGTTLGQGEDGDELNAAWDVLVEAIEERAKS